MTKKETIKYWRDKYHNLSQGYISFTNGKLELQIPPDLPGLKRLRKKVWRAICCLELHPLNNSVYERETT